MFANGRQVCGLIICPILTSHIWGPVPPISGQIQITIVGIWLNSHSPTWNKVTWGSSLSEPTLSLSLRIHPQFCQLQLPKTYPPSSKLINRFTLHRHKHPHASTMKVDHARNATRNFIECQLLPKLRRQFLFNDLRGREHRPRNWPCWNQSSFRGSMMIYSDLLIKNGDFP